MTSVHLFTLSTVWRGLSSWASAEFVNQQSWCSCGVEGVYSLWEKLVLHLPTNNRATETVFATCCHYVWATSLEKKNFLPKLITLHSLEFNWHSWQLGSFSGGTVVKNLPASTGDTSDRSLIPGFRRSPGKGNGNLLQYSCLENSMDRGAWQA